MKQGHKKWKTGTTDNILVNVYMSTRRSVEMKEEMIEQLNGMLDEHSATGEVDFELRLKI